MRDRLMVDRGKIRYLYVFWKSHVRHDAQKGPGLAQKVREQLIIFFLGDALGYEFRPPHFSPGLRRKQVRLPIERDDRLRKNQVAAPRARAIVVVDREQLIETGKQCSIAVQLFFHCDPADEILKYAEYPAIRTELIALGERPHRLRRAIMGRSQKHDLLNIQVQLFS